MPLDQIQSLKYVYYTDKIPTLLTFPIIHSHFIITSSKHLHINFTAIQHTMPRYILMQYIQNLRTDNTGITQNNRKLTLWPCQRKKADESSLTFVGVLMSRGGALLTVSLPRAWWLNMDAIGVELL